MKGCCSAVTSSNCYQYHNVSFSPFFSSLHFPYSSSPQPSSTLFNPLLPIKGINSNSKSSIIACSSSRDEWSVNKKKETPAKALRRILDSQGIHQCPASFDALSAKLVQSAGFPLTFTSGFSISAARLGLPDTGLISYGEMVDQGRLITQAVSIPVIGDADNGYGNALNVKRTLKGYIQAGFAGIMIEDQVSPKACGHTHGRKVVSREEAVMRIKAAVDARNETASDIVIVARTDSRQAVSFDEALTRVRAFAEAGADVLFIDALTSKEEMRAFCEVSPLIPKLANMLEGGGKTPILNPMELEDIGYKLVAYPLSLIGVSIRAMQDSLTAIKGGRIPPPGSLPSFEEIKDIVGFNAYYEEEKRYTTTAIQQHSVSESSSPYSIQQIDEVDTEQKSPNPTVEVITPDVYNKYGADNSGDPFPGIWSRTLKIKITGRDGSNKLDLAVPAGFIDGITNIVPALGGVNIKDLLANATGDVDGKLLLDINDRMGDRIQVFLG
ncbi:hypothetical protein Lal_00017588 [Lupinus albus]|uniref:Putative 2,3-dimethylmalate lyase n=1 Tax=Lupinus albus TaxID=3870 RepID=A0A6A4QPM4_LUPAL|nr:putative 2,3-dimethylmalate lyase [Lupinus albus]KAF1870009.1 hypothetical protein Lal_00017588 [Lupinus albus]